jgi:hypothetical protein
MQTPGRSDLLLQVANVNKESFGRVAGAVFALQRAQNPLYAALCRSPFGLPAETLVQRGLMPAAWEGRIPFLPVSFFKTQGIKTGEWPEQTIFSSSGTAGQTPSQHPVRDLEQYLDNTRRGFAAYYGDPSDWAILALLPSYLERTGSSLVAMADYFIRLSKQPESGFFLHDFAALRERLQSCRARACPTLLLGVSFALLDFAETTPMDLSGITVMETGGMKGRRAEMTRAELHQILQKNWNLSAIHSEYGMTELFSQAYAVGGARFQPAPAMRVIATEIYDPFGVQEYGKTGVLNILDLANLDTCSFIQTEDVGRVFPDGSFEVLGRLDAAELRGCNLMVE